MSSRSKVVDEGHVGGREQVASEWETIRVVFHDFAKLPSKRGDRTFSPVLECHGLKWQIQLYPGGHSKSSEETVFITLRVSCKSCTSTNKIKAKYKIRVPSAAVKVTGSGEEFRLFNGSMWGHNNYAKREDVLDSSKKYLVDGNLIVEVEMQVLLDKPPAWSPTNTLSLDMLKLMDDTDNADVLFDIGQGDGGKKQGEEQRPHSFNAHRVILLLRCPALAELAEDCDPDTPIPIGDIQADVFRMLLRFIYGGEVPSKDVIKDKAKDIIHAADKYGCTGLKLAVEAEMAAAGGITTDNAAELILFADGTNCAMLKEVAMDFFVKHTQEVMASEGFCQVKESPAVMAELMAAMASGSKKRPASSDADAERDFKRMRVATLRQKLDEKKLGVDGSKDMLISRLEAAEAEARAQAEADAENGGDGDEVVEIE